MQESLSIEQARKLVLLSQKLLTTRRAGSAKAATLSAIEHLGYVQIDAISVIERAHHHTLWNRNPRYKAIHLDQLLSEKKVFEYWSHAAAYLPMCDYRFSLIRKQALKRGEQKHWYEPDQRTMKTVLRRIESEGPLMAKDFEHTGKKVGEWKSKPAKKALEYLFMQGDLMVPCRKNFHKVYDLTERVLPKNVDTSVPNSEEYARYLIIRYLQANGLGMPEEMAYLLKGTKPIVIATLNEMIAAGEIQQVTVAKNNYYAIPDSFRLLGKRLASRRLKILSPFDNLVIQRKRINALFAFDYQIECYVPESKRKYGYFCLPILWDGRLVARMDCKVDRDNSLLQILHLAFEQHAQAIDLDPFFCGLQKELTPFLRFNDCDRLQLDKTTHRSVKRQMKNAIIELMT